MTDEPIIHLKCVRTGRVYRVVAFDSVAKTIKLQGASGCFVEPLRPLSELREMGYERVLGPFEGMLDVEGGSEHA